jgi:neutral trehalase
MVIVIMSLQLTNAADPPEYLEIKKNLKQGWNTWNTRSVLSQVLLPGGLSINLALKQHYFLEEQYLREALIGRYGKYAEQIRPGAHAYDGSYTELEIRWEEIHAKIQTAHDSDDLVIMVIPLEKSKNASKLIIESGMLWNMPGNLKKVGNSLSAELPGRNIDIFTTASHVDDFYVQTKTPYLSVYLDQPIGISTGKARTIAEIETIIKRQKDLLYKQAQKYSDLSEAYIAVQAGIAWNLIYEPKHDRVVSTVGRLWNEEYGGYCLFGWDNFFMAYITGLESRDLAFANVLEHLKGKTEGGFIPNDNRGNGSKSWDRSQPPVGGIMVKEIYKRYPEKWFLKAVFDDLLGWNRWWLKRRLNEGLLSYGSHPADNPFNEPVFHTKTAAGYESGMDDSPMYIGVPFNKEKNTLELQDVGLNCLVIADCKALTEMARILGRAAEEAELMERVEFLENNMESLWDEEFGLYLNRHTDTGRLSKRLSPTLFYPLLAELPDKNRARRIVEEHFFNPEEFYGEWMLPSTARNDSTFHKQRYWKGAIWPPLNFLTYLSLRKYKMKDAYHELAEKSMNLFISEWKRKGYVSENYSSITGTGDDERLSSDRFHSWGALFGIISFIDRDYMPPPEDEIE